MTDSALRRLRHHGWPHWFQRQTVDHVMRRFHDPARRAAGSSSPMRPTREEHRARVHRSHDRADRSRSGCQSTDPHICSNSDLANQNLKRLNILGAQATHSRADSPPGPALTAPAAADPGRTAVNLVSFTPGTSFSKDSGAATRGESALSLLLWDILVGLGHEGADAARPLCT